MYGDCHVMRYILELSCYVDMPVFLLNDRT